MRKVFNTVLSVIADIGVITAVIVGINTIQSRITEKAMNEIRHIQKKLDSIEM